MNSIGARPMPSPACGGLDQHGVALEDQHRLDAQHAEARPVEHSRPGWRARSCAPGAGCLPSRAALGAVQARGRAAAVATGRISSSISLCHSAPVPGVGVKSIKASRFSRPGVRVANGHAGRELDRDLRMRGEEASACAGSASGFRRSAGCRAAASARRPPSAIVSVVAAARLDRSCAHVLGVEHAGGRQRHLLAAARASNSATPSSFSSAPTCRLTALWVSASSVGGRGEAACAAPPLRTPRARKSAASAGERGASSCRLIIETMSKLHLRSVRVPLLSMELRQ